MKISSLFVYAALRFGYGVRPSFGMHAGVARDTQPDAVGYTKVCNSYPQALTLARHIRELLPEVRIVLGTTSYHGRSRDSAARSTDRRYRTREEDLTFPLLLDRWKDGREADNVLGVAWRAEASLLLQELDQLPFPAYDLYPVEKAQAA